MMSDDKMREEFEARVKAEQGLDLTRLPHGGYRSFATHQAWWAWQASLATHAVQGEPVAFASFADMELCMHRPAGGEWTPVYTAPPSAGEIGEVVVTKDKLGNIVYVTRQDAEGGVLSVIAESEGISLSGVLAEGYFHPLPDENDYEFHDAEQFPDGSDCTACVPAVIVRRSAVENQLAPDVVGLAGKMARLIAAGNRLNAEAEECIYGDGIVEVASSEYWCDFRDALEAATEALAAYRKGGEE